MPKLPSVAAPAMLPIPARYDDLSPSERREVRERYIEQQGGVCHYCGSQLDQLAPRSVRQKRINWSKFPPNFLRYPVHLHHDHQTGLTIGAVHAYCNAVLWQYHGE
jgi:hypothetical protein